MIALFATSDRRTHYQLRGLCRFIIVNNASGRSITFSVIADKRRDTNLINLQQLLLSGNNNFQHYLIKIIQGTLLTTGPYFSNGLVKTNIQLPVTDSVRQLLKSGPEQSNLSSKFLKRSVQRAINLTLDHIN